MNIRLYLSYDIKNTLESHFWHENDEILPYIEDVVMVMGAIT